MCVCVCLYWNNIQKKERERERPQKRDRVVVQGITALKTTPTLNVRALLDDPLFVFLKALHGARVPLRI